MRIRWLKRVIIGLCFALPFGVMAAAVSVQAQTPEQSNTLDDCRGCHEIIETHWEESAHAKAITNTVFQQAWTTLGQPSECLACHTTGFDPQTGAYEADSLICTVCHNPVPTNHPEDIMPTDISSRMCGE